jgi:hypothetical protein
MKLLIMQFAPTPGTSFLFCPNILLSTMFSNTLSLCCSFNVSKQIPSVKCKLCSRSQTSEQSFVSVYRVYSVSTDILILLHEF